MTPRTDPPTGWEDIKDRAVRMPDHVVQRKLVAETVLLNVQTGVYYGLDEVGGRFLEVLSRSANVEKAVEGLAGEFNAPLERIRDDTVTYCKELLSRGLIELEGGDG